MSKDREIIPRADMLMGSMRSMGYSFEAAVADIIDNSISAKSSTVRIFFPETIDDKIALGILDDGIGMSKEMLSEAMRYGSSSSEEIRDEHDLGRFGLGLKAASLSQCKVLTVACYWEGSIDAFSWDYDYILETKKWFVKELSQAEIIELPYYEELNKQKKGTLVLWQNFDTLSKSNEGLVFNALETIKPKLDDALSLIFHRYIGASQKKLSIYINNKKLHPQDPFLENHRKITTKKESTIAIKDSNNIERHIRVRLFVLPVISDMTEKDKKLIGGIENLRSRQGFYVYRNNRLIIWGTWFGLKPRAELSKNARVRVDIPNSLDDIWSIDIKKQSAAIPLRIKNQLKKTVEDALEISTAKHTHRGRKEKLDDDIDYIWDRYEGRNKSYFYQINRESKLFQFVRSQMSEADFDLMQLLLGEIEKNLPIQQLYIDKSNEKVEVEVPDSREDDVFQIGVNVATMLHGATNQPYESIIENLMKSEPFCKCMAVKDRLTEHFAHEVN